MNPSPLETSLRDLATVLFKRGWSVLIILLTTVLSAALYLFLIREEVYQTNAKVLVKLGHEQAPPLTVLGDRPLTVAQRFQDVNSEIDILSSTQLLEQVVDRLGLDKPSPPPPRPAGLIAGLRYDAKRYVKELKRLLNEILITVGFRTRLTPREQALAMLESGLLVQAQKESNVVVATMLLPVREGSSVILNQLLDLYLGFRLKIYQDSTAVDFFQQQTDQALHKLQAAQERQNAFEASFSITALQQQKLVLLNQIAESQGRLQTARGELERAAAKVARLGKGEPGDDFDFASLGEFQERTFPDGLLQELAQLQRQREQLRMTDLDDGVRISNNRAQFRALTSLLTSNLRSVLAEKQTAFDSLQRELASQQSALRALHDKESQWQSQDRRVKVLEQDYLVNQKKLQESLGVAALEHRNVGNVLVIQRAIDPLKPVGMRKSMLLALAFAFGLLAAAGWAVVTEFFDHRIFTAEELGRCLDAPVAAVIPLDRSLSRQP